MEYDYIKNLPWQEYPTEDGIWLINIFLESEKANDYECVVIRYGDREKINIGRKETDYPTLNGPPCLYFQHLKSGGKISKSLGGDYLENRFNNWDNVKNYYKEKIIRALKIQDIPYKIIDGQRYIDW